MHASEHADPIDAPHAAGWCLRLIDGNMAWSSWPLSEMPLRIGRGLGCRLRLDDTRVSRIQCEVWLEAGKPFLQNRSEANPTSVNGTVVDEAPLAIGDLIEFAGYRLITDLLPMQPAAQAAVEPPTTRAFQDTPFQREAPAYETGSAPGSAGDLLALFHFSRKLAASFTLDALADAVRDHLGQRMRPERVWLAWPYRPSEEMILYPAAGPDELAESPQTLLRLAAEECRGLLQQIEGKCYLVAPLCHGRTIVGVIGLCLGASNGSEKQHLDYLLAAAECIAPHLLAVERLEQLSRDAEAPPEEESSEARLLGETPIMSALRLQLRTAAASHSHVLLLGESGTGKELAARLIHDLSERSNGPYVAVNCAAIPGELFDSEMFGYEKGAFTGAAQRRKGLFEEAHGGTLFLDEVGELSKTSQARLLRAADLGLIRRIGAATEVQANVRIVSATNRPLPSTGSDHFRLDLFHRLAGFVIHLPSLRDRRDDIPLLAEHFRRACTPQTQAKPTSFSPAALEELRAYDWPGNVRELRNVVERACYLARTPLIDHVPLNTTPMSTEELAPGPIRSLDEVEQTHLQHVLALHAGDVAASAKALGIPKSTLYYKLSRHGISKKKSSG